jgi:hypothetical protein
MLCLVRWRILPCLMLALLPAPWVTHPAQAVDALKETTSLKFVPADVDFFVAGLRHREQFDKLVNSQAFSKLANMPMLQMGLFLANAQWENPQNPQVAMLKAALQQPENQQLIELLKDAVSHEVFVYGERGFGDAIGLMNQLNAASNAGQLEALAAGEPDAATEYQLRQILEVLQQQQDQLKVPNTVIGFRLSSQEAATAQLARLETLVTALLPQAPPLQGRFSRENLGGGSFLTLRLDGSLVPWEQIPLEEADMDPEQARELIGLLKELEITISLGVRDDYLLLSLGENNRFLGEPGTAGLLIDREEMAVMEQDADKPLVGIGYTSAEFIEAMGSVNQQLDQLTAMAKQFLPMAPISSDLQEELIGDIDRLSNQLKSEAAEPGVTLTYSFLTPAGYETYAHNWGENKSWDASQPLTILNHLGGTPIAFYAARGTNVDEDYGQLASVVERVAYYVEQIATEQMDDDQRGAYQQLKTRLMPLVERLGQVTREKLVPAFRDGQGAIVLDAKSTSDSWHLAMPPAADGELPIFELALVYGVSDAGLVREACGDYFEILQQSLDILHEASTGDLQDMFPDAIPKIELARPRDRNVSNGTIYYYVFPAESGLDEQIAMNAGLSEDTMVLSLLPRYTQRLLSNEALESPGPLANVDRPLAAAGQLDFAGLIGALEPWVDYGIQLAMDLGGAAQAGAAQVDQARDVLEVLKCFRGIYSVTYQEGDRMVTHLEWRFEDLP